MKKLLVALGLIILLSNCIASTIARSNTISPAFRRFMIIVGSNDGGSERVSLRYAHSDTREVAKVFQELGGVQPRDCILLLDPSRESVLEGLAQIKKRATEIDSKQDRIEAFFYYSGHSDGQGLLLGDETLTYKKLIESVEAIPSDVVLVILDGCASGNITRLKGGKFLPPIGKAESPQIKGYAYITSASNNEPAQESDEIGGSFFTHAFVTGLRGAADVSLDRTVTLMEAYSFAREQTLHGTVRTYAGIQHASYLIELEGKSDFVITDLRNASSSIVLDESLKGDVFVWNSGYQLVGEVSKEPGDPLVLGFAAGKYTIELRNQDNRFMEASVTLSEGHTATLASADFRPSGRNEWYRPSIKGEGNRFHTRFITGVNFGTADYSFPELLNTSTIRNRTQPGLIAGIMLSHKLPGKWFSAESGVLLQISRSVTTIESKFDAGDNGSPGANGSQTSEMLSRDLEWHFNYLTVPVLLRAKWRIAGIEPYAEVGPEVGFLLSAYVRSTAIAARGSGSSVTEITNELSPIKWNVITASGFNFRLKGMTAFMEISYSHGFDNALRNSNAQFNVSLKNRSLALRTGVRF